MANALVSAAKSGRPEHNRGDRKNPMLGKRHLAGCLLLALSGSSVQAAESLLWKLQSAVQASAEQSQGNGCQQVRTTLSQIKQSPRFQQASHLCKEEISELEALVGLVKQQDATANDLFSSGGDVQQACSPFQL